MYNTHPMIRLHRVILIFRPNFSQPSYSSNQVQCILNKMSYSGKKPEKFVSGEKKKMTKEKLNIGNNYRLQVIGTGANGASRCVQLIIGPHGYLFNCGEGMQRLSFEYKTKLSRSQNIFITYPSWENIGGLIGVALTLQNTGSSELYLHGPDRIECIFSAIQKFANLRKFQVIKKKSEPQFEFSDGIITVKYIHLYPALQNKTSQSISNFPCSSKEQQLSACSEKKAVEENEDIEADIDYYKHLHSNNKTKKKSFKEKETLIIRESQAGVSNKNTGFPSQKYVVCYICKTNPILGGLHFEKCMELGVPPGPLLGKLKRGEDVTLENGNIIKSSDVKEADQPGPIILVVECPSEEFLDSLLNEQEFCQYQCPQASQKSILVIVHFTDHNIVKNSKYVEWINRFSKETKHVFINESNTCLGSVNVNRLQYKLNMLHPKIFPLLPDHGIPYYSKTNEEELTQDKTPDALNSELTQINNESDSKNPDEDDEKRFLYYTFHKSENNFIYPKTLCEINLSCKHSHDYSNCLVLKKHIFLKEVFENEDFESEFEKWNLKLKELNPLIESNERKYPKILFLGTGSSFPSKTRNSSGILVFLDPEKTILLDCGEGTYSQLVRFFGKEKARSILKNLCAIYISHLHVDHHLGLITLLKERKIAFEEPLCYLEEHNNQASSNSTNTSTLKPLFLFAPIQISRWLNLYNLEFEEISSNFKLVGNSTLININPGDKEKKEMFELLNFKELRTTYVHHCPNAFGVSITHKDGWKLTYSGDTRPCENLIILGKNSDILIHEATMDHTLKQEAIKKLHSTTEEAILVGKKMNAKFIILTHFSQRYCYIPLFCDSFTEEVGLAFDNMMVSYNELPLLSNLKSPLQAMFLKYYNILEEKVQISEFRRNLKRRSSNSPECEKKLKSYQHIS